jgi:hypothetical protein
MERVVELTTDTAPQPVRKPADREATRELSQSLSFYDGAARRTLYVSNDVVAEFAPSEAGRTALLASSSEGSELDAGRGAVRLWRVRPMHDAGTFTRNLSSDELRFSLVLHDGPSSKMPKLALPGGVVATFPAEWTREQVDAWLAVRKLSAERELVAHTNMFLVPTRPGVEALDVANRLYETGELVACTPNWWREASVR